MVVAGLRLVLLFLYGIQLDKLPFAQQRRVSGVVFASDRRIAELHSVQAIGLLQVSYILVFLCLVCGRLAARYSFILLVRLRRLQLLRLAPGSLNITCIDGVSVFILLFLGKFLGSLLLLDKQLLLLLLCQFFQGLDHQLNIDEFLVDLLV